MQQMTSTPAPQTLAHTPLLQSCLSNSWGGLEMVAYENALSLSKKNFLCYTLCLKNSPLERYLLAQGLLTFSLDSKRTFFDFIKVRQFIKEHDIQIILIQLLKDIKMLSLSILNFDKIHLFAMSHTFVNVDKKDIVHNWAYKKIQKLICLTELHKSNLLEHLPLLEEQVEVIPNYVDCERFHPKNRNQELRKLFAIPDHHILFGIASRLDPQKGQNQALKAMARLKQGNISASLVILGENTLNESNYGEVLKKMSKDLGLEDRVYFAGHHEDMEKMVASLDVLLMPSKCETFGRVLIEAMASKTPLIATSAGGVPNIIENEVTGLLVPAENDLELANAMERLAHNPELRQQLAESAYFKVRHAYDKNLVEERLLRILEI